MADNTKIEWTDATWNIITGCSVVSAGCRHCYAMKLAGTRLQHHPSRAGLTQDTGAGPVWNGEVRFNEQWLTQPLEWKRPRRIFVCAHGDLFHETVPDAWIDSVFSVMIRSPQHVFQVLTKRPARMLKFCTQRGYLLPNVWLGVSVEDQAAADERIPLLLQTPAAVRWISAEPLLGPVSLDCFPVYGEDENPLLHWIVAGGESGPKARPMHPEWARGLRDQCAAAGVPFLFKQWGEWEPRRPGPERDGLDGITSLPAIDMWPCGYTAKNGAEFRARPQLTDGVLQQTMWRVGKKAAGRLLDGVLHDGYPEARP